MIFVFSSRNFEKLSLIFTYFVCAGFITVVWHSLSLLHRRLQLPHCRKYGSADLYNFVWLWMFTLMIFWHMVSEKKMRNPLHTHANKNGLSYPTCSRSKIMVLFFWDETEKTGLWQLLSGWDVYILLITLIAVNLLCSDQRSVQDITWAGTLPAS